jgi:cysteine desulfurase/selenocysteine lyase
LEFPNKKDFPVFEAYPRLAYLDNAATTQRPRKVIEALSHFYSFGNANIHRGIYDLSNQATAKYEHTREEMARFLGAESGQCIAFTKGTTESINIVAKSFLRQRLEPGDNLIVTLMEHHANFIPWQQVAKEKKAELRVLKVNEKGELDLDSLKGLLDGKTRMVTLNHVSNTLGTVNNIQEVIGLAHQKKVPVMIDAAQSAAYYDLDQKQLGYDLLAFPGHKLFGPFGIGILYASPEYQEEIEPYNTGGGMITSVGIKNTHFMSFPHHLDAGTSNIGGVIGLGAAIDFIGSYDQQKAREHLTALSDIAVEKLSGLDQVKVVGSPQKRSGIVSFVIEDIHPHDVASWLNQDEIAVRAGMHCTQPLLESMGLPATVRASFSIYNDQDEIERLVDSLQELIKFWQ